MVRWQRVIRGQNEGQVPDSLSVAVPVQIFLAHRVYKTLAFSHIQKRNTSGLDVVHMNESPGSSHSIGYQIHR